VFLPTKLKSRSEGQHAVSEPPKTKRSFAEIALSDGLDAEFRTQQALADALTRIKKVGQDMISRVKTFEVKHEGKVAVAPSLSLDLWQPDRYGHQSVNFEVCFRYSFPYQFKV
jgi:hypothetical protein